MLVPLLGGAYEARSIIASAQRCINLYPESNPKDSPAPSTHYPTPGLTHTSLTGSSPFRGLYTASNGTMYIITTGPEASVLFSVKPNKTLNGIDSSTFTFLGFFNSTGTSPISMADNGLVLIIVDGTTTGWAVDLTTLSPVITVIKDPVFVGASKVDYLDTFFIFNVPETNEWYISLSEANFEMFTGVTGSILTGDISNNGNGTYTNSLSNNVTLTGGTGTGALASITIANNSVSSVVITTPGTNYIVGDLLSAALPGTSIGTGHISVSGAGYTDGTYTEQSLTGGNGANATGNIIVSGGAVTSVTVVNPGINYRVGNVLSATLPGGASFNYIVDTIVGSGFTYTVQTVGGNAFDVLDFAAKVGYPDPIVTLIVMDLYIWLLGAQTTEIWFNAGAADFVFQIFPGVFIEHGCAAQYSVARQDLSIYWLSRDKQGQCIVLKGNNFAAHRISTFAIENEFSNYSVITDAIGFTYQQNGHVFYVLTFPTADKTWVWDETSQLWHERASLQTSIYDPSIGQVIPQVDGNLHRVIYNCCSVCGGLVYVGDYFGNLWLLDLSNYTEHGVEIQRIRSFPHLVNNQNRITYQRFIADVECGTDDSTVTSDNSSATNPPVINLRWSDDRGKTYGNYVAQSLGELGKYLTSVQWRRLGYARDRIFELSWSTATKTALNGAWVETTPSGT